MTVASKEAITTAGRCQVGDVLGLVDGDIVEIGDAVDEVALRIIDRMRSSTSELVTLVTGSEVPDDLVDMVGATCRMPCWIWKSCPAGSRSGRSSSAWSSVDRPSPSLAEVLGGRSAASLRTSHSVTTCEDLLRVFPGGIRTCPGSRTLREFGLATWLPSWPASKISTCPRPARA